MNTSVDYDLVGYLLGALDEAEHGQVEAALERDLQLRQQLQILDHHLHAMREECDEHAPPDGLADRTCLAVAETSGSVRLAPAVTERSAGSRKWSMTDVAVAVSFCLAAMALFFPAVIASRQSAEVVACQNNLVGLGTALNTFNNQHNGRFPVVPTGGNRAIAGTYAPVLSEAGYVDDPSVFICPSSVLAADWQLPTLQELDNAFGERLISLQRMAGGSYAYTLGYAVNGTYYPTRNLGRKYFVVMADVPCRTSAGWRSANHGQQGHNVLFEDFHVEFVSDCCFGPRGDIFFENDDGFTSAGLTKNDAVVGASDTPPLRYIRFDR